MNSLQSRHTFRVFLSFLNLAGYLIVLVTNTLATTLPLNNKTTGQLSDNYPNLFVPAGLTFSIWGVIYLLLGIYSVFQIITAYRTGSGKPDFLDKIGYFFFISCILNAGWIFAWHFEVIWLSVILMILLLASLITIYLKLGIGKKGEFTRFEKALVHPAFSIYLGWITIATIANITGLLVSLGWNGFGLDQQFWAVLVTVVGILITLAILFLRNDIFFSLVIIWALAGILVKRVANPSVPAQLLITLCIAGIVIISMGIILQVIRHLKSGRGIYRK